MARVNRHEWLFELGEKTAREKKQAESDRIMEELHQEAVAKDCPVCGTGAGESSCECSQ